MPVILDIHKKNTLQTVLFRHSTLDFISDTFNQATHPLVVGIGLQQWTPRHLHLKGFNRKWRRLDQQSRVIALQLSRFGWNGQDQILLLCEENRRQIVSSKHRYIARFTNAH